MATGSRRGGWRGVSVARLRLWLAIGVVALMVVLAGLLGYARYKTRRLLTELPHKLGIDIKSETNGFTWSQSVKGHTLFSIHAAKAIQRENGKTTLHDVIITVFGPEGSNRKDIIRGDTFEYDQPNGVVRAEGIVHIDLAAPSQPDAPPKPDAKRMLVTTSGLIFLQKLGVANTDKPISILYGDLKGAATGADYVSDSGLLRLHSAVQMDGMENRQQVHLRAGAAELNRNDHIAVLQAAQVQADNSRAGGDTVTLALGANGVVDNVHAVGHAWVEGAGGSRAEAPVLDAHINNPPSGPSHMQVVHMSGGVVMQDSDSNGTANDAVLRFDPAGNPTVTELTGAVQLHGHSPGGAVSLLTAPHVVAQLMQDDAQHTSLREATATGGAMMRSTDEVAAAVPAAGSVGAAKPASLRAGVTRTTTVTANTLHAVTAAAGTGRYVSRVDGNGATRVDQTDDAGYARSSTGDTLVAVLAKPQPKAQLVVAVTSTAKGTTAATPAKIAGAGSLESAVQTGHVTVMQHTPARPATATQAAVAAQDSHAQAAKAEFDGATQRMVLTGAPVVTGPGVQMAADRIALEQGSSNADADGNVKGTFVQTDTTGAPGKTADAKTADAKAPPDPVHVLADRAHIVNGGATAQFFGVAAGTSAKARPARMWSSTSQVDAVEIDVDRAKNQLTAKSAGSGSTLQPVHLLMPAAAANPPANPIANAGTTSAASAPDKSKPEKSTQQQAVRITGPSLVLTGATATVPGHAVMTGGVVLTTGDSQMTSAAVDATLASRAAADSTAKPAAAVPTSALAKPAPAAAGLALGGMMGGSVQSILATGGVHLQQPGRTAIGERLLYTAADDRYLLTGTPAVPPRVDDSQHGNVTGASLIFHAGSDSVEVAGETGRRVRTETDATRSSHSH